MLNPSMQELMKRVGNRYLLVNLAAQRARDIADEAEEKGEPLPDKAVKLALDEIDEDKDENADEVRRLNEFDDGSLSDGDIPEEDL